MHWFKVVLICLCATEVLIHLINSRKGEYTELRKAWQSPLSAVLDLLILWGVIAYL
uniref:Uncharacterized protein n=1 Tax=viral metagenome TaxID=1070528 RepID=A0A6M3J7S7_9ZZZZ